MLNLGSTTASTVYLGSTPVTAVYLGSAQIYGTPTLATYSSNSTYTIPAWCSRIDVICLGGGGGGQGGGGAFSNGDGGAPGAWAYATLIRGTTLSWATTALTVTVGAGGARGYGPLKGVGGKGESSLVVAGTTTLVTAAGGSAGSSGVEGGDVTGYGPSPTTLIFNTRSYTGGGSASSAQDGKIPGGGGGGGLGNLLGGGNGGTGARGSVWIYAY